MSLPSKDEDSFAGKSWSEICDAERAREKRLQNENSKICSQSEEIDVISKNKETSENEDLSRNEQFSPKQTEPGETGSTSRMNFKTSNGTPLGKGKMETGPKVVDADTITRDFRTPSKPVSAVCKTPVSYAKIVQGLKPESNDIPMPMDTASVDDLSLTSHLDVFHVASPLKTTSKTGTESNILIDENTIMFSPEKEEIPVKNMKRPFQLIESPRPRPRSASDSSIRKIAKSIANSDVHSSTIEEIEEGVIYGSEDSNGDIASPNMKRELEVNPEILSRRQKQIDYGKNTLGYDRYSKVIPKHKRDKEHPKTPPKHLKMSRRAWDGLVKNWRLKLHRWDPISDKDVIDFENANFDQYSFSSEEPSSYDSSSVRSDSAPSTPKPQSIATEGEDVSEQQWTRDDGKSECSKELWSDCQPQAKESNNDEFLGCEVLTESCVKAYS